MAVMKAKETSELWFERYLRDHGLDGGDDHHPDLGVGRRPDYRVSRGRDSAICEVKEFTTSKMAKRFAEAGSRQPLSLSNDEVYGSVRNKISQAAKEQLKPVRHREEALVVVLANPRRVYAPLEQPDDIIAAMYGNQAYSIAVNLPEQSDDGQVIFTRDGVLTAKHRYVSAIATLHRGTHADDARARWYDANRHRWAGIEDRKEAMVAVLEARDEALEETEATPGDYIFVRVYSTISTLTGEAVSVPRSLFNGPRDQYWAMHQRSELELVHGTLD